MSDAVQAVLSISSNRHVGMLQCPGARRRVDDVGHGGRRIAEGHLEYGFWMVDAGNWASAPALAGTRTTDQRGLHEQASSRESYGSPGQWQDSQ